MPLPNKVQGLIHHMQVVGTQFATVLSPTDATRYITYIRSPTRSLDALRHSYTRITYCKYEMS